MPSQTAVLSDAFAVAAGRYDLLCGDYRRAAAESTNFFSQDFIDITYQKSMLETLTLLRQIFRKNYVDFAGHPLIDDADLLLSLDHDLMTPNAWVVPKRSGTPWGGGIEITTTLGLVVVLDMLCAARWVHISELFPDQPTPEADFDKVCSQELASILQKNLPNGLSDVAKLRLADFFSAPSEEKRRDWTRLTTLSTLWVLSHEVGHFLCGHVGHHQSQTGIIGLSERTSLNAPEAQEVSINEPYQKVVTTWARELMADAYGTIRLSLIISGEVKQERWSGSIREAVDLITTASILPGVAFLLGREATVGPPSSILTSTYPSEWCRVFGVLASVVFAILPLPSTAMDPRKNPAEEFWQKHLFSMIDQQMFMFLMLEIFDSVKSYLNEMNLVPFPQGSWDNVREHLCGSLLGSRTGIVTRVKSPMGEHLLQWMYSMKLLCRQINFDFSLHLARSWMTGKTDLDINEDMIREDMKEMLGPDPKELARKLLSMNFTNDPAYKILDDWMSNIYTAWELGSEAILERQDECAGLAQNLILMWRNM